MTRLRSLTTLAVAAAATFIASGCANDSPAAPKSEVTVAQGSLTSTLGSLLGTPKTITPVLRTTPLPSDVSVAKTIGVLGGTLVIPEAGVTIVVPPLAVSKPTDFRVTARAGSALAYDFEPHGIKFAVPLVMTQSLRGVQTDKGLLNLGLSLGYYPDPTKPTSVTELLNVTIDLVNQTAISTIWHFSGYIYASGRDSDSDQ
jgi:ZU5 domain